MEITIDLSALSAYKIPDNPNPREFRSIFKQVIPECVSEYVGESRRYPGQHQFNIYVPPTYKGIRTGLNLLKKESSKYGYLMASAKPKGKGEGRIGAGKKKYTLIFKRK